jgi:hypothetical protein
MVEAMIDVFSSYFPQNSWAIKEVALFLSIVFLELLLSFSALTFFYFLENLPLVLEFPENSLPEEVY